MMTTCLAIGLRLLANEQTSNYPHPKYARVRGDIETIWQRPLAKHPLGIFFIAHGCNHQAPDLFNEVTQNGWEFKACEKSYFGHCLGLPEEVHMRHAALDRGYIVVAVSGGAGKQSCWAGGDLHRVKAAIEHVREVEGLDKDIPVLATGASSGGALMGALAMPGGLQNLKCIVPQVSGVMDLTWSGATRKIPTLFVYMPRDGMTADMVEDDYLALQARGVRVAKLEVGPRPVTADFLERCLSPELAKKVAEAMRGSGLLDREGLLKQDARGRKWVGVVEPIIKGKSSDTLVPDESCLSERLNVAWAFHEFAAQYATEMLDFCEGNGEYAAEVAEPAQGAGGHKAARHKA